MDARRQSGPGKSLPSDWSVILDADWLVQAHVKAGEKLIADKDGTAVAGGEAYNVCDTSPSEPYEFFKPLFDAMNQPLPWATVRKFCLFIYLLFLNQSRFRCQSF